MSTTKISLKKAALRDRDLDRAIAKQWSGMDTEAAVRPMKGEIYLVAVDPDLGLENQKTRPAMVIQNETSDLPGSWTMVAPITRAGRLPLSPLHVPLPADSSTGLTVASVAALNHILSLDCKRLIKKLGVLDAATLAHVDTAIRAAFGLSSDPPNLDLEPPSFTDAASESIGNFKIGRYQR